ncbi:MAG TPA: shikimate dehydrogenase [Beijerinckiaceae bacterium]|jgi:shikimate dehydrogenase
MSAPRAFVVGHPVAHSRSPLIHNHWLAQHGLEGSYERVDVPPGELSAFLARCRSEGYVGGNVTIPHKEAAFDAAALLAERARRLRAVNTLWFEDGRLHGDNTDSLGFIAHLDASLGTGWDRAARRALVLGAGGAARAVAAGLLDRGLDILVANRTEARAQDVAALDPDRAKVLPWTEIESRLEEVDLLVNATSLGMVGQPSLSLSLAALPKHAVVADIVYAPLLTSLLAEAEERDLRAVDGLGMLLHQAVPGFERWFGVRPKVTAELRALIVADLEIRR